MKSPILSVVIPVFNCDRYLAQAIDSVFQQGVESFEIIAVDDGSTDSSAAVLHQYQAKDSRIRVIEHKINRRQGAARNNGLREARGEFVFFLDADDWLSPGSLGRLLEVAAKDSADVVACGVQLIQENQQTKPFHSWAFHSKGGIEGVRYFSEYKIGALTNKLYRVDFLRKNKLEYSEKFYHEDIPFAAYVALLCERYVSVSDFYYNYRVHDSSTVRKAPSRLHLDSYFNLLGEMERYCQLLDEKGIKDLTLLKTLMQNYGSAELFPKFKCYASSRTKSVFTEEVFSSAYSILGIKGLTAADMVSGLFSEFAQEG